MTGRRFVEVPLPFAQLALGLVLADAVLLLDLAGQPVPIPGNDVELVVGQAAPFFLDGSLHLFPVTLDTVPIHDNTPFRDRCALRSISCAPRAKHLGRECSARPVASASPARSRARRR